MVGQQVGTDLVQVGDFGPFDALAAAAHAEYIAGRSARALQLCREGLVLSLAAGDLRTERYLRYVAAILLLETGHPREAREQVQALLDTLTAHPDRPWRAKALTLLAEACLHDGRVTEAMDLIAEATRLVAGPLRTYQDLAARQAVGLALRSLHLYEQSDVRQMSLLGRRGVAGQDVELTVLVQACLTQVMWGITLDLTGDAAGARAHHIQALSRTCRIRAGAAGQDRMLARADAVEGFVLERLGEDDAALAQLRRVLAEGHLAEELAEFQLASCAMALLLARRGDVAAARQWLEAAQRPARNVRREVLQAWTLAVTAEVETAANGPQPAALLWRRLSRRAMARLLADRADRFAALQHRIRVVELQEQTATMGRVAAVDPLTGVGNRRMLDARLETAVPPLSVIFADVDRFKDVNDRWSHAIGDQVLRRLAEILRTHCREDDVVVRYGGDEFVVLLRADADETDAVAGRILSAVRAEPWGSVAEGLEVTVSLGVASDVPVGAAVAQADLAMHAAKRAGRNRAVHS